MPSRILKVEIHPLVKSSLAEFGRKHNLILEVRQHTDNRWTARFKRCETLDGAILSATYGDAPTAKEAAIDYARKITGKLLVFSARGMDRQEIWVPELDANETADLGLGFRE